MSLLSSIAALALAVQTAPAPPAAKTPSLDERMTPQLQAAAQAVRAHQPRAALATLAPVIATYDADLARETRRIYCGMSVQETLLYLTMAAKDKVAAVAVPPGYCTALYLKGYALVDLGRMAEAKAIYERLLTPAPMYAQYQTEYGQLIRLEKDWPHMLAICTKAGEAAAIADPALKPMQQAAALRCQGYALTELHRYDEAEKRYRDALAINPKDAIAQHELGYIAQQRAKAKPTAS
ncbi:tetratricopeptide repeat protein [Sphingomonas zeae]